ncbi:nuclear transport factor 2 family protein [Nakamurella sp.]|uniref:nuclear transport factor 2 family protein n=1 Tax=Nakamurella sp. TaxID=1869182 RepID=UPI003784FDEA
MIDEEQIRAVDDRRTAAMVAGDLPTLRELIADDCRYVHSTGVSDTKDSYLAAIESGALAYTWIGTAEHIFIRAGDAMLVPHEMRAELVRSGVPEPYRSRAVAVWRATPDGPRLIYFQATALPAGADRPSPETGKPLAV